MFKKDDILCSTWGYEQTNVDFFQVIRTTPKMVIVREIKSEIVESGKNYTGTKKAIFNDFKGEEIKRKVFNYGYDFIEIESFANASLWDGDPVEYSSYY